VAARTSLLRRSRTRHLAKRSEDWLEKAYTRCRTVGAYLLLHLYGDRFVLSCTLACCCCCTATCGGRQGVCNIRWIDSQGEFAVTVFNGIPMI